MGVGARADIHDATGWNATQNGGVAIGTFALQDTVSQPQSQILFCIMQK